MGNVERVDKTLATNEMVYYVRKDPELRKRWNTDREGVCREFGLSQLKLTRSWVIPIQKSLWTLAYINT